MKYIDKGGETDSELAHNNYAVTILPWTAQVVQEINLFM